MPARSLLVVFTYILILVGLVTLNGTFFMLALPFIVYLVVGTLDGSHAHTYTARRRVHPYRNRVGEPIAVQVEVTCQGEGQCLVQVRDDLPQGLSLVQGSASILSRLRCGEQVLLEYQASGKRGVMDFPPLEIIALDALALSGHTTHVPAPAQVVVLPYAPKVRHVAIRPRRTQVYAGNIPSRVGGRGVEFYGVRHYQAGDALRHLNWRLNARHPEALFTNEYVRERVAEVWLILDARLRSEMYRSGESFFEFSVMAAASLAQAILTEGNRVGLLVYGGFLDWVYPGYGKVQEEHIARTLARARTGESLVFAHLEHLPTRLFPLHSQIILVSPLHPEDASLLIRLRARGYNLIVLSPDPIAFEAREMRLEEDGDWALRAAQLERRLLFAKLRQAGVQVLNWDVSIPFEAGMHRVLMRLPPWHFLQGVRA